MRMSIDGACMLVALEGIVPCRYRDIAGKWTYGIGHTAAAGPPDPETVTQKVTGDPQQDLPPVLEVFRADLAKYEADVVRALRVTVRQHEFDALVMFHFNTGAIARAKLTRYVNDKQMVAASNAFMNWCRPASIRERRRKEQELFATGRYFVADVPVRRAREDGTLILRPFYYVSKEELMRFMSGYEWGKGTNLS